MDRKQLSDVIDYIHKGKQIIEILEEQVEKQIRYADIYPDQIMEELRDCVVHHVCDYPCYTMVFYNRYTKQFKEMILGEDGIVRLSEWYNEI